MVKKGARLGNKRCEIGQKVVMRKGAKLDKKGARLGNK